MLSCALISTRRIDSVRNFLRLEVENNDLVDETVKVPQMAESISEGTLKTWQKKVGDRVEQDEEVATIETDKVCTLPSAFVV